MTGVTAVTIDACAVRRAAAGRLARGLALLLLLPALARAGAIVTAADSPLHPLDAEQARRVFLGLQHSVSDQIVTVIYQTGGPVREDFDRKVLHKQGAELNSFLSAMIFTGRVVPPVMAAGDAAVKQKLQATPDAIGYVSDSGVDASVKVLLRY